MVESGVLINSKCITYSVHGIKNIFTPLFCYYTAFSEFAGDFVAGQPLLQSVSVCVIM